MKYSEFVDYSKLDPVKRAAIQKFTPQHESIKRLGLRIVPETLGEPAIAIDFPENDFYIAFNVEGLGTKNMIADSMSKDSRGKGVKYYESVGKDTVAMNTNDLSAIGADPIVYGDIVSSGDSNWFTEEKAQALLEGYRKASEELQMAIPCGETPTLKGIVSPETLDLCGAAVGIIKPKENLIVGKELQAGDVIIGLESSGVHANGISLIRKTAEALPEGYFTQLPESGRVLGEVLLEPTMLYSRVLMEILQKAKPHYFQPITGHGWKKIMRNKKLFSYDIDFVPEIPEVFRFLQEKTSLPDVEAFYTWNMGVGFVVYSPKQEAEKILSVCEKHKIKAWELGKVVQGEKTVNIKPKNVIFKDD